MLSTINDEKMEIESELTNKEPDPSVLEILEDFPATNIENLKTYKNKSNQRRQKKCFRMYSL